MVWSIWTGIVDTPLLPAMMSTLFIGSFVVVLLFGVMYLLSFVFLAKDIAFYAALPIPQRRVFMARFLQVLLAEDVYKRQELRLRRCGQCGGHDRRF